MASTSTLIVAARGANQRRQLVVFTSCLLLALLALAGAGVLERRRAETHEETLALGADLARLEALSLRLEAQRSGAATGATRGTLEPLGATLEDLLRRSRFRQALGLRGAALEASARGWLERLRSGWPAAPAAERAVFDRALDEARVQLEGNFESTQAGLLAGQQAAWGGLGLGLLGALLSGVALRRAWHSEGLLERELARKAAELSNFGAHMKELHRLATAEYPSLEETFDDHLRTGRRILDMDLGSISERQGERCTLRALNPADLPAFPPGSPAPDTICTAVAQARRSATWTMDAPDTSHPAATLLPQMGLRAHLAVPITSGPTVFGVLSFASLRSRPDGRRGFSSREIELAELLARSLAARVLERERQAESQRATWALVEAREAAAQASRLKSEFLAVMSHEMRTPLSAVVGVTELLLDTRLDPQQRDFVDTVRRSSEMVQGLINDVLDISKIEAGKLELQVVDFAPRAVVDDVATVLGVRAAAKELTLRVEVADNVPARLRGDAGRLRQVLTNLVANAVKFTPRGSVQVRVSAAPAAVGVELRVEVEDQGPGIPSDLRGRLFQPFSQIGATEERQSGTGLGLAISRQLVECMGGSIGVESEVGRGSVFWFTLPLAPADETEAHPPAVAPPAPSLTPVAGWRVLVAEDDPVNARVVRGLLERLGCIVDVVDDGGPAASAALARDYSLVLMDGQLPTLDGLSATREIRARERAEGRLPVPILALTANAFEGERRRCLEAGMDDYLAKPVRRADLQAALERWARPPAAPAWPGTPAGALHARSEEEPAVALGALEQLADPQDPSFLGDMIEMLLRTSRERLLGLREAVERLDAPRLAALAHSMQGGAGLAGALPLARLCAELERDARAGDISDAAALLRRIEGEFRHVELALRRAHAAGTPAAPDAARAT